MSRLYNTISQAVSDNILTQPFDVADVNRACNNLLLHSPAFLSKHAVGNPGGYTEYFIRVSPGKYKLR